jgi:hypothetical protein
MPRVKLAYPLGDINEADFTESETGFGMNDLQRDQGVRELKRVYPNMADAKAKAMVEHKNEMMKKQFELEKGVTRNSKLSSEVTLMDYTKASFVSHDNASDRAIEKRNQNSVDNKFIQVESWGKNGKSADFNNSDVKGLAKKVKSLDERVRYLEADFSNHVSDGHGGKGVKSVKKESTDFISKNNAHTKKLQTGHANFDNWGDTSLHLEFNNSEIYKAPIDSDTMRIVNKSVAGIKKNKLKEKYNLVIFNLKSFFAKRSR